MGATIAEGGADDPTTSGTQFTSGDFVPVDKSVINQIMGEYNLPFYGTAYNYMDENTLAFMVFEIFFGFIVGKVSGTVSGGDVNLGRSAVRRRKGQNDFQCRHFTHPAKHIRRGRD